MCLLLILSNKLDLNQETRFIIKVCSKMHGLPCRGLAASISGCNMKNSTREPKGGLIKRYYLIHILIGHAQSHLFINISVKSMVWPVEVFQPQEASPRPHIFSNIHENHYCIMIFNGKAHFLHFH